MSRAIRIEPLTPETFAPFGEVLQAIGPPTMTINSGMCGRFHDLARLDFGEEAPGDAGRPGISIFQAEACRLPLTLSMVERHPLGSQAVLPNSATPFLVIVARHREGVPGRPRAFLTAAGQGVNYRRGVWHGVLTPMEPGCFFVVDRIGEAPNLEEFRFDPPFIVGAAES